MYESLTGRKISGYQILEKVKEGRDWEEYRIVKDEFWGRLFRILRVVYYPSEGEYETYLQSVGMDEEMAGRHFAARLEEILKELTCLEQLSQEDNQLLPVYESNVEWDSNRKQYMIYMVREEALSLWEWENNQDITAGMLLGIGEQIAKGIHTYQGENEFHIGDIYVLSKDDFRLGNLHRCAMSGYEEEGRNPLSSIYNSYLHRFYGNSQEKWEHKNTEEKRIWELLCFLHYYANGKRLECEEETNVSKQIRELLVFCTQNQVQSENIAEKLSMFLEHLSDEEREQICVKWEESTTQQKQREENKISKWSKRWWYPVLGGLFVLVVLGVCVKLWNGKDRTFGRLEKPAMQTELSTQKLQPDTKETTSVAKEKEKQTTKKSTESESDVKEKKSDSGEKEKNVSKNSTKTKPKMDENETTSNSVQETKQTTKTTQYTQTKKAAQTGQTTQYTHTGKAIHTEQTTQETTTVPDTKSIITQRKGEEKKWQIQWE